MISLLIIHIKGGCISSKEVTSKMLTEWFGWPRSNYCLDIQFDRVEKEVGLHKFSEMIPRMLVCSDLVEVIVQYICLVLSCERIGIG